MDLAVAVMNRIAARRLRGCALQASKTGVGVGAPTPKQPAA
jgi:hypothetical protein